jgi:3-carboxy-cis,cis-muconate cycloisomerase
MFSVLSELFAFEELNHIFADITVIQRMLDFEAALARAEAEIGVIPSNAAVPIAAQCKAELYDLAALQKDAAGAGNLLIPLIKQLTARVKKSDAAAARYVHWGATSQDAIDTGLVLQLRAAFLIVETNLQQLRNKVAVLADEHRATPIAGRSWMQHAVPTTLGFKFAGWLDGLNRQQARLAECRERSLVLQFGGAVGTLASLGENGLQVAGALARELQLALPEMPWHTQRDRVAEVAATFGLLTGTLGKIARDISLMTQSEVREMAEPEGAGRGGSSTMPHKRNAVTAAVVLAAGTRVPGLVSTMLSAMLQEHERGLGGWHAEWETLPEIIRLSGGALFHLNKTIGGLELHTGRMREGLDETRGLIFSERVAMALGQYLGKSEAHAVVEEASAQALKGNESLQAALAKHPKASPHFSGEALAGLFDPLSYLGTSNAFIDRTLTAYRHIKGAPKS